MICVAFGNKKKKKQRKKIFICKFVDWKQKDFFYFVHDACNEYLKKKNKMRNENKKHKKKKFPKIINKK